MVDWDEPAASSLMEPGGDGRACPMLASSVALPTCAVLGLIDAAWQG